MKYHHNSSSNTIIFLTSSLLKFCLPAAIVTDICFVEPEPSVNDGGWGEDRLGDRGGITADLTMPQNCTEHRLRALAKSDPWEINLFGNKIHHEASK